ncbi:hypothetical protein M2282_006224 [Variovorax boronicumulans]|uniref:hypothetical protein n=1 Tax=Variovorax boronicumulans TaxID=436515 RepID=UPI0024765B95|nr:hypothetical protein [Variovorax boronicumulans]MDH6171038.1 hypothetical protein [Variovorax boronicumulans]
MIPRTIPIQQVKPNLSDAVRMAVGEIERFLGLFYPADAIRQTDAAKAVAGQWLSRVKGFHNDDDFLHLTRDFLSYVLSGGERSQVADQLGYYFSGFMPSYGAARTLLGMAADSRPWSEVQAFMHSQSYGDARKHVETFDWRGGEKKAKVEIDAWKGILQRQVKGIEMAAYGEPVLLAQASPQPLPNAPVTDVPPANEPYMPRARPPLRLVPPVEPPPVAGPGAGAAARGALALLAEPVAIVLFVLVIVLTPSNAFQKNTEDEDLRRWRAEYEKKQQLPIPDAPPQADAVTDTANNDCKPQSEENKKNGAECEDDGYVLMEQVLQYRRLVNPPKGKGLDGLFEKSIPFDQPNPMPLTVAVPKPGKLVFIPTSDKPPQTRYDYVATELKKPVTSMYPKFVVFEAKHIAKTFDPADTEGIQKEAKNRLGNTCDGTQLGTRWTTRRIPQALNRHEPGAKNRVYRETKGREILDARYARWIFICLPGALGAASLKLYVFIDVVASGMDLESRAPKPRKTDTADDNKL